MQIHSVYEKWLEFHPENGGSMAVQNVGILPHHYMVSQPRRLQFED
jgi:hypothetical protein